MEKLNHEIKQIHHQIINKWDGPVASLKVRKRVETEETEIRRKRKYQKEEAMAHK